MDLKNHDHASFLVSMDVTSGAPDVYEDSGSITRLAVFPFAPIYNSNILKMVLFFLFFFYLEVSVGPALIGAFLFHALC